MKILNNDLPISPQLTAQGAVVNGGGGQVDRGGAEARGGIVGALPIRGEEQVKEDMTPLRKTYSTRFRGVGVARQGLIVRRLAKTGKGYPPKRMKNTHSLLPNAK